MFILARDQDLKLILVSFDSLEDFFQMSYHSKIEFFNLKLSLLNPMIFQISETYISVHRNFLT